MLKHDKTDSNHGFKTAKRGCNQTGKGVQIKQPRVQRKTGKRVQEVQIRGSKETNERVEDGRQKEVRK
jgi:hypothetical protein